MTDHESIWRRARNISGMLRTGEPVEFGSVADLIDALAEALEKTQQGRDIASKKLFEARATIRLREERIMELTAMAAAHLRQAEAEKKRTDELGGLLEMIGSVKEEATGRGRGYWRACTGCHESEMGQTLLGQHSTLFGSDQGIGCLECGGIGVIWDDTDYDDMADFILREAERAATCDVLAERQRQIEVEGWTPEHDDEHGEGEIALAAACYAVASTPHHATEHMRHITFARYWPWAADWWKPRGPRENLVRAGALILAEIERLDRTASKASHGESDGEGAACPICTKPILPTDLCATDINLGVCHADCLQGCPVVDLESGEPVEGPMDTYRYSEIKENSHD